MMDETESNIYRNNSSENESDNSEEENIVPQMDYDPNSARKLMNIELQNNQHILIEYQDSWSIEDLILAILRNKEYRNLKQNRNLILNGFLLSEIHDLALCFYDSIIQPHENRIDKYIMIDKLHELQILKNYRTPFFIMKDNFTPLSYIYEGQFQISQLNEVHNARYNQYAMYLDYLPRISKWNPNILFAHPELEDYYSKNKKFFNEFKPYKINLLSCDNNKVDWFIYDKESINFLIDMEKKNFVENSHLKYINGKLYFEDKLNNNKSEITDEDLNKIMINLIMDLSTPDNPKNIQSRKVKITTKTTGYELIVNFNSKLGNMDIKNKFDPKKKILKVRSLNDYIFDLKEPLINFSYINECIRLNLMAEYLIIDNPEIMDSSSVHSSISTAYNESAMENNLSMTMNTTFKKSQMLNKLDIKNIASYNPILSNRNNNDLLDKKMILDKGVNIKIKTGRGNTVVYMNVPNQNKNNMKSKLSKINKVSNLKSTNLESFVDLLETEVEREINEILKGDISSKKNNDFINNYEYYANSLFPKQKTFLKLRNNNDSDYLKLRKKYKNFKANKKTPNVFASSLGLNVNKTSSKDNRIKSITIVEKNKIKNIKKRKPLYNRDYIKIVTIRRPFSILFRSAEFKELINSYDNDQKFVTILLFKFELYNSNELICPPKQIRWKTSTKVQQPYFNKRIYFDIGYAQLPSFCSIIFKVKKIKYDKNNNVHKSNTIFWANYRLFDQNNRLKVGLHKINLHDREVSDDIYYSFNDNPNEDKSSKIYFEIENFVYPVINAPRNTKVNNSLTLNESQLFALEGGFLEKINKIDQKSPFDELNNYEKMTLWRNRFAVSGMASLIPRLFLSCDYNNPNTNQEIEQLTKVINGVSVVQAIELLSGKYVNEYIRKFAVNILREADTVVIQSYLLQLIQALKYEKNHDSALARFLIEQAILHPITIGHEFFWHLRSEMFNQNVQQRFGLYLEVFLNKISKPLYKIFKEENTLLKNLVVIAEKIKIKKNKEERDKIFKEDIDVVDGYLKINKKEVSLPLNFKYRIKGIISDKCRIMKSKKKPLWLTFENADPLGDNIVVMLKCGDDLRMDMVTLQLFKAMQNLWYENGLKLKMSLYKVLCTGNQQGMLEMVTNSETLANIHVKEGGALNQIFSKVGIKNWIEKNCTMVSSKEAIENFMLSNVAYCLATFVLGIGDRHNDNIMIKKNGELFHIDFGHFLGHFKYKMGIKRERAAFVFTRQFQSVLGGDNSEMFKEFKSKMERGYIILRNHKEVILTLLKILLCTGIPELNEKSLRFLENSLLLKRDDKEAIEYLNRKINDSMDSMSTKLNFAIHIVANK